MALPRFLFKLGWPEKKNTDQKAPKEVMRFERTSHRIIRRVLTSYQRLGPVYLRKVYLSNAYMYFWVRI